MQQKVQELADRIYQDGVQKGEKKAEELVAAARKRGEKELSAARDEAKKIVAAARTEAEELRRNVDSEIKLGGQQALSVVKQSIVDVVSAKVIDSSVDASLADARFVSELIKLLVTKWDAGSPEAPSLEVLLPEEKRKELEEVLKKDVAAALKRGLKLTFSSKVKNGFQVSRADRGYKISMTDDDFKEFIKEYLRPKARDFLFG